MMRHLVIEVIAYQLWEKAGRPEGQDLVFWLAAEKQYKQTHGWKGLHLYSVE